MTTREAARRVMQVAVEVGAGGHVEAAERLCAEATRLRNEADAEESRDAQAGREPAAA